MAQLELNGHGSVCMWVKSLSRAGTVGAGAHALLLNERERTVPYRTVWRDKVVVVQSCGCWAAAGADGDAQHSFVIFTLRGVRRGEEKKEEKKDIFK